jgi:hypothetical protein
MPRRFPPRSCVESLADIEQDDLTIGFDLKRLSGHDCLMTLFVWNRTSNKQIVHQTTNKNQTNAIFLTELLQSPTQ